MDLDIPEYERWVAQAINTISSAENDLKGGFFNWACFKSQQAAQFAIKGLLGAIGNLQLGIRSLNSVNASGIQTSIQKKLRILQEN